MSDTPEFTVRKAAFHIPISNELLEPPTGPPPKPTFRWPSFICGYEYSDDYYTEGHSCELPAWHVLDGTPHFCSLEWETRPSDICRAKGHEWGGWGPVTQRDVSFMRSPFGRKAPTKERRCGRCGQQDTDGVYDHSWLFPKVSNGPIPRVPG